MHAAAPTLGQLCSLKLTRLEQVRATWLIACPVMWLHLNNSRDLCVEVKLFYIRL